MARPLMPLGTVHEEPGRVMREGVSLILERDDGGRWRLDADELDVHLGRRVVITGTRTDFDELTVTAVDGVPTRRPISGAGDS